jgi:HlyD family secretion protein
MNTTTVTSRSDTTTTDLRNAPSGLAARRGSPRRKGRRWLPWLGAVVVAGLIVAGLWPRPLPVETATVSKGALRATVNEEGKTRIRQRYVVAAPVAGQLRRIPFKAGAEVKAGETVIAVIDPLPAVPLDARTRALAEARRDSAAASVERARSQHEFAAIELRRSEKLAAEKTLTAQELEAVQWREVSAARELAAAQAASRAAEAELAEFAPAAASPARAAIEVKSPAGGRVLRVVEESSRVVPAGAPLVEIGDPAELEVVVEVLSRDGAVIAPGTAVELHQWGGSEPLQALVRMVEPAAFTKVSALGVEEQRVNLVADITTPAAKRAGLGDNFRVEARIVTWEGENVLKVPGGALFRRGGQWGVFVIRGGTASLRPVKVGRSSGTETQVLEGLAEGELIVVYPGDRIQDGARVKPISVTR